MGAGSSAPPDRGRSTGFARIGDNYTSLPALQQALRREGLESSQLIIGIDATKSNTWTGKFSYGNRCLHHIDPDLGQDRVRELAPDAPRLPFEGVGGWPMAR